MSKRVTITVTMECPDDIPGHVVEWMAANVCQHVEHEFDDDYDPSFVEPPYGGPPSLGGVEAEASIDSRRRITGVRA